MRLTACLFGLTLGALALPGAPRAQEDAPPPRAVRNPPAPERREVAPAPRPPPPPRYRMYPVRPYHRPHFYYRQPPSFWWGWGWGWGWYPLYANPVPPPPEGYVPERRSEAERIYTRISLYGAGRSDGYMGGFDLGLDGRWLGFDLDASAIARESVTGPLNRRGSDPATWGTAHLTWTVLSDRSFRLRVETGASMLSLPDSPAVEGEEWRGKTLVGPDVGVSGQLGIVGPLGVEGHARLTPIPTRVADVLLAATVHGGPLGLSAGWRWIDVAGNGRDAPKLTFQGPQVGLSLAF
jgi:hypothetical protein